MLWRYFKAFFLLGFFFKWYSSHLCDYTCLIVCLNDLFNKENNFFFHYHHDKGIASLTLLRFFIFTIFNFLPDAENIVSNVEHFIKRLYKYIYLYIYVCIYVDIDYTMYTHIYTIATGCYNLYRLYNGCFGKPPFMKEIWAIS